ncbi:MerR-like DNA binding protein [Pedobacter nutrimenti]|uniref:MerR-like DNA binding protein n=2 Tax=Pedobacter nutrimenti TaxID=1241337 RepID=A0A318UE55_9SPHI|nr:MerR-like DNA binding protein [Pedobacter nutrimenti]
MKNNVNYLKNWQNLKSMSMQLIKITEYCVHYNIEPSFLISLEESGIISLTLVGPDKFIQEDQFSEVERYIHLHYDLQINIEGIDAIRHLLGKLTDMQQEITVLKNRLQLHETLQRS